MNLQPVHPNFVCQVWPRVEAMLTAALLTGGGEYNVDQLKAMLVQGSQCLLLCVRESGDVAGAFTVAFENYPNDRIAFVTAVGGRAICDAQAWGQFEKWARDMGCTKIRGAAHDSVARLWRQKFNVQPRYLIVEKSLDPL